MLFKNFADSGGSTVADFTFGDDRHREGNFFEVFLCAGGRYDNCAGFVLCCTKLDEQGLRVAVLFASWAVVRKEVSVGDGSGSVPLETPGTCIRGSAAGFVGCRTL